MRIALCRPGQKSWVNAALLGGSNCIELSCGARGVLIILVESLTRVHVMPTPLNLFDVIKYTDSSHFAVQRAWCFHGFREGALQKLSSPVQGLVE